jgi:hypothetical protein
VTATDLETDFLAALSLPNLDVLRHDVPRDDFAEGSSDFVHARAVIMHIGDRMSTLSGSTTPHRVFVSALAIVKPIVSTCTGGHRSSR